MTKKAAGSPLKVNQRHLSIDIHDPLFSIIELKSICMNGSIYVVLNLLFFKIAKQKHLTR